MGAQEGAAQVDLDFAPPFSRIDLRSVTQGPKTACAVDQHVDRSQLALSGGDHSDDGVVVGDVGGQRQGTTAGLLDQFDRLGQLGHGARRDGHLGAGLGRTQGDRASKAPAAACDQDDLFRIHGHSLLLLQFCSSNLIETTPLDRHVFTII